MKQQVRHGTAKRVLRFAAPYAGLLAVFLSVVILGAGIGILNPLIYRNNSILAPRQAVARVAGDLQSELPVPSFMEETADWRAFQRQAAQDERARRKPDVLLFPFAVLANHLDGLDLPQTSFRDHEIGRLLSQQITGARQT